MFLKNTALSSKTRENASSSKAFWAALYTTFLCDAPHASRACPAFTCGPLFSSPQSLEGGLHPGVCCRLGTPTHCGVGD